MTNYNSLEKFYIECILGEYADLTLTKNKEKAKLLAEKYQLPKDNIERTFDAAASEYQKRRERKNAVRMSEIYKKERIEYASLTKYANLSGKEKRIAMLKDLKEECLKEAKSKDESAEILSRSLTRDEGDWATLGGIASGIAGPAAGLATAVNVQSENERIRAQNAANLMAAAPLMSDIYGKAADLKERANQCQDEIEKTNLKLVGNEKPKEVLKDLQFMNPHVEVKESGSLVMTVTVSTGEKNIFIYDDVPAVVDGTVEATIIQNGDVLTNVKLVLPLYGIGSASQTRLKGMSLGSRKNADKNTPFEFQYSATNLWKMEQ